MTRRLAAAFAVALTPLATAVVIPAASTGTTCASLAALTIPNVTIKSAEAIAAGPFTPPGATAQMTLPAFCRVEATARPTSDSDIKFEVWIPPVDAWNGKFQGVGNGGYQGSIWLHRDGHGAAPRLRDGEHRHRPHRRRHEVRPGPSGKGDRLRPPRDPRDDRSGEADRPQRHGPLRGHVVFRRLLRRRPSGAVRSAALSRGLRRHRRRRSRRTTASVRPSGFSASWMATHAADGKPIVHAGQARAADQVGRSTRATASTA